MAGLFSWSVVWYKTQAVIAQKTRVCAFDRAAYGFSDPASRPQIVSEVVEDLHTALKAGSIPGPYVLAGHSLGGLEARVYAQRWPEEVAGMSRRYQPGRRRAYRRKSTGFRRGGRARKLRGPHAALCFLGNAWALRAIQLGIQGLLGYLASDTPAAFKKMWPQFFTADYFADKVSLMSCLYTHRYDSADHHRLGAIPLVVLSIEHPWNTGTTAGVRLDRSYGKIWNALHQDLARLSSRGVHRIIKGSGHEIQLDKPQAVIDAVQECSASFAPGRNLEATPPPNVGAHLRSYQNAIAISLQSRNQTGSVNEFRNLATFKPLFLLIPSRCPVQLF